MNQLSELNEKDSLLKCPFFPSCILPKSKMVCDFPHYKLCDEFQSSFNKLKSTFKILH